MIWGFINRKGRKAVLQGAWKYTSLGLNVVVKDAHSGLRLCKAHIQGPLRSSEKPLRVSHCAGKEAGTPGGRVTCPGRPGRRRASTQTQRASSTAATAHSPKLDGAAMPRSPQPLPQPLPGTRPALSLEERLSLLLSQRETSSQFSPPLAIVTSCPQGAVNTDAVPECTSTR